MLHPLLGIKAKPRFQTPTTILALFLNDCQYIRGKDGGALVSV
jgi:hypothetical protein